MGSPVRIPEGLARGAEQIADYVDLGDESQAAGDSARGDPMNLSALRCAQWLFRSGALGDAARLVIPMDEAMYILDAKRLLPGDIIFTRDKWNPASISIRTTSLSRFSHAILYVEAYSYIDSDRGGVTPT